MDAPKKMQLLELEYQQRSGLIDRDWYTIFYSRLCSADLIVLGINPGGKPTDPDSIIRASTTYYENWEHEYVDSSYPIQAVMLPFLRKVMNTNNEGIRTIPKSNLIFRRSPNENAFKGLHKMTAAEAMREAQPTICEILQMVSPKMVILEGKKDRQFNQLYCSGIAEQIRDPIWDKFKGSEVRVLEAKMMHVECLDRQLPVIALGHPSHFGKRRVWGGSIMPAVRELVQEYGISAVRQ